LIRGSGGLGSPSTAFPTSGSVSNDQQLVITPDGKYGYHLSSSFEASVIDTTTGIGTSISGLYTGNPSFSIQSPIAVY